MLYIKDAQKAGEFYEKYKGELDEQTNNYRTEGRINKFLLSKGIRYITANMLYALVAVLGNFDTGMSLHKIDFESNRLTYDSSKIYKRQKEVKSLKFIVCNY